MYSHIKTSLVIFMICACSYFNIFAVPFQFDGVKYIKENLYIINLVEKNDYATYFWQYPPTNIVNRPILNYTYTLNYYLGKDRTLGYHLISLWIHFGSCLFVYLIFRKTLLLFRQDELPPARHRVNAPMIAAMLFASHPVQTQTVTYIMSRSASLCTLLYLASFYCFVLAVEANRSKTAMLSGSAFAMGLLSLVLMRLALGVKLIIVSLPLVMFIYFFLFFQKGKNIKSFLYQNRFLAGVTLAPLLLFTLHQIIFAGGGVFVRLNDEGMALYGRWRYLLSQVTWLVFYYLKIWLFPFNLNIDPAIPAVTGFSDIRFVVALLILIALILFIRKQSSLVIFGSLWLILALAPESSFIPLLDLVAEQRLYLPGVGFVLIVAMLFVARKWAFFHVLLILCFSAGTIHRNGDWVSEKTLWQDAVEKSPGKWRPLSNYARALDLAGVKEGAVLTYQKAIEIEANHFESHHNLANIYAETGKCLLAIDEYNKALSLVPNLPESLIGIGKCYKILGDYEKAVLYLKHALEARPSDGAYRELGLIYYFNLNDKQAGAFYLRQAVTLNPNHPGNATILNLINR